MDYKKVILAVAGKLYKKPEEEVTDLLKTEGSDDFDDEKTIKFFEERDKEKVTKIKGEAPKWSDAINKANKEVWTKVETTLKEKFSIESELQGEDLLDEISKTLSEKQGKEGAATKPMTEEEIKASPFVAELVKKHRKELVDVQREGEMKVKEVEGKNARKEMFADVTRDALAKFKKMGEAINLPSDPEKANKTIKRLFIDELDAFDFEKRDGKWFPIYKDGEKKGKHVEDDHGYSMSFDDFVEKIANQNFDFKKATDRTSPDHSKNGKPVTKEEAEKSYTGKEPSTALEFIDIQKTLNPEQRRDFVTKYGPKYNSKAFA